MHPLHGYVALSSVGLEEVIHQVTAFKIVGAIDYV
jgi:hypothetical protein